MSQKESKLKEVVHHDAVAHGANDDNTMKSWIRRSVAHHLLQLWDRYAPALYLLATNREDLRQHAPRAFKLIEQYVQWQKTSEAKVLAQDREMIQFVLWLEQCCDPADAAYLKTYLKNQYGYNDQRFMDNALKQIRHWAEIVWSIKRRDGNWTRPQDESVGIYFNDYEEFRAKIQEYCYKFTSLDDILLFDPATRTDVKHKLTNWKALWTIIAALHHDECFPEQNYSRDDRLVAPFYPLIEFFAHPACNIGLRNDTTIVCLNDRYQASPEAPRLHIISDLFSELGSMMVTFLKKELNQLLDSPKEADRQHALKIVLQWIDEDDTLVAGPALEIFRNHNEALRQYLFDRLAEYGCHPADSDVQEQVQKAFGPTMMQLIPLPEIEKFKTTIENIRRWKQEPQKYPEYLDVLPECKELMDVANIEDYLAVPVLDPETTVILQRAFELVDEPFRNVFEKIYICEQAMRLLSQDRVLHRAIERGRLPILDGKLIETPLWVLLSSTLNARCRPALYFEWENEFYSELRLLAGDIHKQDHRNQGLLQESVKKYFELLKKKHRVAENFEADLGRQDLPNRLTADENLQLVLDSVNLAKIQAQIAEKGQTLRMTEDGMAYVMTSLLQVSPAHWEPEWIELLRSWWGNPLDQWTLSTVFADTTRIKLKRIYETLQYLFNCYDAKAVLPGMPIAALPCQLEDLTLSPNLDLESTAVQDFIRKSWIWGNNMPGPVLGVITDWMQCSVIDYIELMAQIRVLDRPQFFANTYSIWAGLTLDLTKRDRYLQAKKLIQMVLPQSEHWLVGLRALVSTDEKMAKDFATQFPMKEYEELDPIAYWCLHTHPMNKSLNFKLLKTFVERFGLAALIGLSLRVYSPEAIPQNLLGNAEDKKLIDSVKYLAQNDLLSKSVKFLTLFNEFPLKALDSQEQTLRESLSTLSEPMLQKLDRNLELGLKDLEKFTTIFYHYLNSFYQDRGLPKDRSVVSLIVKRIQNLESKSIDFSDEFDTFRKIALQESDFTRVLKNLNSDRANPGMALSHYGLTQLYWAAISVSPCNWSDDRFQLIKQFGKLGACEIERDIRQVMRKQLSLLCEIKTTGVLDLTKVDPAFLPMNLAGVRLKGDNQDSKLKSLKDLLAITPRPHRWSVIWDLMQANPFELTGSELVDLLRYLSDDEKIKFLARFEFDPCPALMPKNLNALFNHVKSRSAREQLIEIWLMKLSSDQSRLFLDALRADKKGDLLLAGCFTAPNRDAFTLAWNQTQPTRMKALLTICNQAILSTLTPIEKDRLFLGTVWESEIQSGETKPPAQGNFLDVYRTEQSIVSCETYQEQIANSIATKDLEWVERTVTSIESVSIEVKIVSKVEEKIEVANIKTTKSIEEETIVTTRVDIEEEWTMKETSIPRSDQLKKTLRNAIMTYDTVNKGFFRRLGWFRIPKETLTVKAFRALADSCESVNRHSVESILENRNQRRSKFRRSGILDSLTFFRDKTLMPFKRISATDKLIMTMREAVTQDETIAAQEASDQKLYDEKIMRLYTPER